jgi:iron(III) transport system substrate-binding protein
MKLRTWLTLGTALLFTLTACGSSPTPAGSTKPLSAAESSSLGGLYKQAKAAGNSKVIVYVAYPPAVQPIFDAFAKDYPGITVTPVAIAGPAMQARLQAEAQSGKVQADLAFLGASDTVALRKSHLFEPFAPDTRASLPAEYRGPDNLWQTPITQATVVAYNTSAVAKSAVPRTWADVVASRWKGKIGSGDLTAGTSGTVSALAILYLKGVIDDAWIRKAAELRPTIYPSTGGVIQGVATGQSAITLPQGNPSAYVAAQQGAPVGRAILTEGMPSFGLSVAVTKNAPHPAAARLLEAYFFSAKAQEITASAGLSPTMPGAPVPPGLEKAKLLVLTNEETQNKFLPAIRHVASIFKG